MKLLFDTNVILDVVLDREPYVRDSAFLLDLVSIGKVQGLISAISITTIYYIITKNNSKRVATNTVKKLIQLFEIAKVDRLIIEKAFLLKFKDFEDAVIHESAYECNAEAIVTRNQKDFKASKLRIYDPKELLKLLK